MVSIPESVMPFYQAAVRELENPEISCSNEAKANAGFRTVNGQYCCDRYVKEEMSYSFYFKVDSGNYYVRVLVMEEDASVCSVRVMNGNFARFIVRNEHHARSFEEWMECFDQELQWERGKDSLCLSVNDAGAYGIDELVEAFVGLVRKEKEEALRDYSLENDCCLEITCYVPQGLNEAIEIEKWSLCDLARYHVSLRILRILE